MNKSQTYSLIFTIATVISTVCAAVLPQVQSLPTEFRFYGSVISIIGAAASAVITAFNQSLSSAHVSIPKRKAKALGLIKEVNE